MLIRAGQGRAEKKPDPYSLKFGRSGNQVKKKNCSNPGQPESSRADLATSHSVRKLWVSHTTKKRLFRA
jgi:hypothetical protein